MSMYIYIYVYIYIHIYRYGIFSTEGFLEVAIESWPKWGLNPRPLSSDQWSNRQSYQAMSSTRSQNELCTATPIPFLCSVFTLHIGLYLRQSPHLL